MEGYSKPISKTTCYDIELWLPKDSLFQSSQRFCRNGFFYFVFVHFLLASKPKANFNRKKNGNGNKKTNLISASGIS